MAEEALRAACLRILREGELEAKLAPVPRGPGSDGTPGPPVEIAAPARARGLELASGAERLPPPRALGDAGARATCLARFAHHELQAVELFAWALLRWPDLPAPLRQGLASTLSDEQQHCRLYLERLHRLGASLGDEPLSGYFWRHAPAIASAPHGARAFLCAMGLTFEQANLDFTLLYRDGFRAAGDEASARVCERVHAEEIAHVGLAATWSRRLAPPGASDVDAYREAVPFPLGLARAKGRRFDPASRRRAGLSAEFVAAVRDAPSTQQTRRARS